MANNQERLIPHNAEQTRVTKILAEAAEERKK